MDNIVSIKHGDYSAKINILAGANCISLKNDKYRISVLREPKQDKPEDNPYIYGMPILFPANRISNGKFVFNGNEYIFPINETTTGSHLHGSLHNLPFELLNSSADFVECIYESDENYSYFPHKFAVKSAYYLSDDGMLQKVTVSNLSDREMPNFIGFHTTFNLKFAPYVEKENVRVYADVSNEIERDARTYIPTGKILDECAITKQLNSKGFKPFGNPISKHYKAGDNGIIKISDIKSGLEIIYENDRKYGWRLFYNGNSEDYICLEPQNCIVDCANTVFDRNYAKFESIPPHSEKTYISKIYIKEAIK